MMSAMFWRRHRSWAVIAGLAACTAREQAPVPIDPTSTGSTPGASGGAGGAGGSGQGASAGIGGSSGDDAMADASPESGPRDSAPDTPLVIVHQDATGGGAPCANDFAALGSNRLLAGGATPADFAAAYNAELAASSTAGPLLLAFYGVNDANLLGWIASFGALEPSGTGAGVGFAGTHVDVPFTLGADRRLHIAAIAADFDLKLVTTAGAVLLPAGSIALDGVLAVGCGSLNVEKATLLVPIRAGSIAFHGSTVEALMGPPTETLGGVPRAAWPLELSGKASQVYAPGLAGDGGIEP